MDRDDQAEKTLASILLALSVMRSSGVETKRILVHPDDLELVSGGGFAWNLQDVLSEFEFELSSDEKVERGKPIPARS